MIIRRLSGFIMLVIVLLVITGCWGKTELNEIGIITVTGVDLEPDGRLCITVMSMQPESAGTAALPRSNTWIGSAVGDNLIDAAKNLRYTANKHLTWIHNSVIIIGKKAAEERMEDVIDFISRNREVRFNNDILIATEYALDILQTPADVQSDLPKEIIGMIDNAPEWSKSYVASAKDFLVSHAENCGNYITGKIQLDYKKEKTYSTAREEDVKSEMKGELYPILQIQGGAVFKKGSLVGWLDNKELRGYLWISGDIETGTIVTQMEDGRLSFENNFTKSSVEVEIIGNEICYKVKVDTRGTLVEQSTSHNIREDDDISKIEEQIANEIQKEMEASVKKLQKEYKSDVLGFQGLLNKKYTKVAKEIQGKWNDEYFPFVRIQYDVNVTIERTGKILSKIYR